MKIDINQIQGSANSALYDCSFQHKKNKRMIISERIFSKLCTKLLQLYVTKPHVKVVDVRSEHSQSYFELNTSDIITADVWHSKRDPRKLECHLHANGQLFYSVFSSVA